MNKTIAAIILTLSGLAPVAVAEDFTAVVPGGTIARDARIYESVPATGGLQAAAQNGNVLQAVNPLAPAKYGTGQKFVAYDFRHPFKKPNVRQVGPYGLRLFAFEF